MGGSGGLGGEQGGSGGTGEGPKITYGSIQTQHFTVNLYVVSSSPKYYFSMTVNFRGNTREILATLKCVAARYNAVNTPEKCMEGT
jgi:hypothetical protein